MAGQAGSLTSARLTVRLTPRGGRDALEGWRRDEAGRAVLAARVAAAPVDGAANEALIALLSRALKRPKRDIRLVAGAGARIKQVEIDGLTEAELVAQLGLGGG
jgi:uncharacterized protein YggU (UPF0235/DUF167 family)